jgi:hypothetical protein
MPADRRAGSWILSGDGGWIMLDLSKLKPGDFVWFEPDLSQFDEDEELNFDSFKWVLVDARNVGLCAVRLHDAEQHGADTTLYAIKLGDTSFWYASEDEAILAAIETETQIALKQQARIEKVRSYWNRLPARVTGQPLPTN